MRIIGNLLWWLFGGLEAAIGYFTGSLALACTIIGIPFALQTIKLGLLCLWPFGSTVREADSPTGCIRIPLNIIWLICGGLWACLQHLLFGFLGSPDKPGGLSIQLCKSEKKEFYIRYSS